MEIETQPHKRPFGLYIIIVLQSALSILLGMALLGEETIATYLKVLIQNPIFYGWFGWVLLGFMVLAIMGLLSLKRWGWILTMILTGLGLAFSIWSYFQGSPHYIPMILDLVIVFYLNQSDVQSPFLNKENSVGAP